MKKVRAKIKYDKHGGIIEKEKTSHLKESHIRIRRKKRKGYNFFEKFIIRYSKKINYLLDEKGQYKCHQEKIPSVLRLGVTNCCTAQCFYCPRELVHGWGTGYMDFGLYRQIIDWASENGVKKLGFALWGEPLLHPRFLEMVDYSHGKGLKMRLSTNAIVLTNNLAEKILDYPFEAIEVSMDGFTREEYLKGKQVDKFDIAKKNILNLLKLAKEKEVQTSFNIHFVDAGNVSFLNKIRYVRFWKKRLKGLKYNTTFYYEPHNWAGARYGLKDKMGFWNRLLSKWELKKPCMYLKGLTINWDGVVLVCGNNPFKDAEIGNVNQESIDKIYNKKKRKYYLTENEKGTFRVQGCDICTVNSIFPLMFLKKRIVNKTVSLFS